MGIMTSLVKKGTYIWVSSDHLDDRLIEITRVTQEAASNVVCVFDTLEDIGSERSLRSLAKLSTFGLTGHVHVGDPAVVVKGSGLINMVLELDDVVAIDVLRVDGAQDWGSLAVDAIDEHWAT